MSLTDYVTLGRCGLKVSPFCLGAMTFGEEMGLGTDAKTSVAIIDRYINLGGNFIDTADGYNFGHSEEIIGDHLALQPGLRKRLVIATKFSTNMRPGDPNSGGAGRRWIMEACDGSLKRLKTDYIDLYWQHWMDPYAPIEETMRALDDLVRAGKIRYIGFSDTPSWRVAQAQTTANLRGWTPLAALQLEYSLLERTVEGELIPCALDMYLGVTTWSPLRSGVLTGKYNRVDMEKATGARAGWVKANLNERTFAVLEVVQGLAKARGTTSASVALAWLSARPGVSSVIIGARTVEQLEQNLAGIDVQLTPKETAALDAVSEPALAFPAAFLKRSTSGAYSGTTVNGSAFPRNPLVEAMQKKRGLT
jgi:aryl-alcohol dehydrogenase-like predicted oxidoreductase